ncbi:MAG TPA: hypothetical protein VK174_03245, partial [Chitinophagales bacterium]|nr:hypothetical protein [Chitinophagales bacterium]
MKKLYSLPFVILLCLYYGQANAQSTFSQVRNLLQANCAGSGCHGAGAPTFDVTASESDLYNALVNVNPSNPAAAAKGNKRVTPGYVDRSFLLRKMAHGLPETNPHLALTQPQEGAPMPDGLPALAAKDIELVRQWILFGAPLTGTVIDTAVINTYYSGKGIDDTYDAHTPPAPGEGFQIYVGKIFIPKQTEIYYYIKHDLRNDTAIEIPKINTMMPSGTHHFIMYKFQPNASGIYAPGLRPEAESSHASVLDGIGTGPNLWQYDL